MKLVLLDRDGVINVDRPDSVKSRGEFILLPNVIPAIKRLNEASIPIAIVTNQAVVGRKELTEEGLADIHIHFQKMLGDEGAFIDKIYICPSVDPEDPRRKPNPGLLLDALQDFQVSPQDAILVGDTLRDLEAASAIHSPRILVRTGQGEKTIDQGLPDSVLPVTILSDLYEAVSFILSEGK